MSWELILNSIPSVGFPAVMTIVLFWYLNKERESHQEELKMMTKSITENTKVLIELQTYIKVLTGVKNGNGD